METKIIVCFFNIKNTESTGGSTATEYIPTQGFEDIKTAIDEGWTLDKHFKNTGIIQLNDVIVYHLVKLTEEEKQKLSLQSETEPNVTDLISVNLEEVNSKLKDGYELLDRDHIYAKTAILIKHEKPKPTLEPHSDNPL